MKNRNRIEIKECCASCQHKEILPDGTRICKLMEMIMESGFRCKHWGLDEHLQHAGEGWGRVKKKEYLAFVLSVREEENQMIDEGLLSESERTSVLELRLEYRKRQKDFVFLH